MTYKLPEGWKEDRLSKHIKIISGGTPKREISSYWGNEIPWISIQDIKNINGLYVRETVEGITKEGYENSSTNILKKDDIIISARGTVGELGLISMPMAFNQSCYGIRSEKTIDSIFLYYFLKNNIKSVQRKGHGSVFNTITRDTFNTIVVQIPPFKEQRGIANTLSILDDKIENNKKIAKNLEAQAQAIFKHWFVDFEFPNEEGKPYKSSGGEMVKSELGMIPKGWRIVELSNVVDIKYGKNLPTKELLPKGYTVFGGNGIIGYYDSYLYKEPQVLVSCRGAASGTINVSSPYSFITNNSLILETNSRETFHYIKERFMLSDLTSYATGSAQPQITINNIKNKKIIYPSNDILVKNLNMKEKFSKLMITLETENQKLSELRDALLPKLISGELRIPLD